MYLFFLLVLMTVRLSLVDALPKRPCAIIEDPRPPRDRWDGEPWVPRCVDPWDFIRVPPHPPMISPTTETPTTEETDTETIMTHKIYIKTYYVRAEKVTWQEANKRCKAEDKGLASITSQEEQDRLERTMKKQRGSLTRAYWIGGYDFMEKGKFKWTVGEPFIYTNWYPGEPNNKNSNEHCLGLCGPQGFKWSDGNCLLKLHYIYHCPPGCRWDRETRRPGFMDPWDFIRSPPTTTTSTTTPKPLTKKFSFGSDLVTWQEANKRCKAKGKELASILSQEEQDRLVDTTRNTGPFWIGANDLMDEGKFEWTIGKPVIYNKWYYGTPIDSRGRNCVLFDPVLGNTWTNTNCFGVNDYICQYYA